MKSLLVSLLVLLSSIIVVVVQSGLNEAERVQEYYKRNYEWPPTEYIPNTTGWRRLMEDRLQQVSEIVDMGQRYDAYVETVNQALLVPNFTETGFGLARCPDTLLHDLREGIRDGLPNARYEEKSDHIDGPTQPLVIDRPDLTQRVLTELQPYAEAWSGMDLTPHGAYGFRLYQNDSRLLMHLDRMQTHVISFILHIASTDDSEPWPIFIEDYDGQTHQVILTPGDMLFYESSKCVHGRPRRFRGSWYTSVFVHYYPKTGWEEKDHLLEAEYAVPPHWSQDPAAGANRQSSTRLEMVGTGMKEPDCPEEWCAIADSIRWSGPGRHGYVITPKQEHIPFHPRPHHASLEEL